jgi:type IV pilus assembly protein PilC
MTVQSTFAYRARDGAGQVVTGSMVAHDADEVGARLRSEGKYVLYVDDKPMRGETLLDTAQIRRNEAAKAVKREDVIAFAHQLSVMLETGVPLSEALDAFCQQASGKEFRQVLDRVREDIYGGETFSMALSKWPRVFPQLMISLMKASEISGTMSSMLGRVGDYLAKERRTIRQIKGALAYPVFMMVAAFALSTFLMVFILPRFAAIYEGRHATLPVPTQVLLAISRFLTGQYMYYGPAIVIIGAGLWIFLRRPAGRRAVDGLRLNLPLLRVMYRQLYIMRSMRTMATLLDAGVNVMDIIEICRGVTNNVRFNELWDRMERGVRDGKQVSEAIRTCPYVPPNIASMIASGERSGRLGSVMQRIAEFTEEELDAAVKQVSAFIEPTMVICMGVVVGGIALALLLPIFKMGSVIAGTAK